MIRGPRAFHPAQKEKTAPKGRFFMGLFLQSFAAAAGTPFVGFPP